MSVRTLLQHSMQQLRQAGADAPRIDVEMMLMAVWGVSATALMIKAHDDVPDDVSARFDAMLQRRLKREPLAYILGVKAFWNDDFIVSSDVLVPRPETEHLIEQMLQYHPNQLKSYAIADIGTGSGCIAVTLAKEYPNSEVTACDISDKALTIAQANAEHIGVAKRMHFYQGDLYQALPEYAQFDVIVSNPPYVSADEMHNLEAELSFEPRFALTDENTGLTLLKQLIDAAPTHLKPNGMLILESGLCGMPNAPITMKKISDYHDLAGNFRGTLFQKS